MENHEVVVPSVHGGLEALQDQGSVLGLDTRNRPHAPPPPPPTRATGALWLDIPHPESHQTLPKTSPVPPAVLTQLPTLPGVITLPTHP